MLQTHMGGGGGGDLILFTWEIGATNPRTQHKDVVDAYDKHE